MRFDSFFRIIIRSTANKIIPLYLILTAKRKNYSLINNRKTENKLLVSLTTFPNRISKIWVVIECVLRQNIKPEKIILWLSKEQFPEIEELPRRLLDLRERGLEIKIRDGNLRSHKKYYYAMLEYPEYTVVTLDDDVLYTPSVLKKLIKLHQEYPNNICCNHASVININNNSISNYLEWENVKQRVVNTDKIMPIGVGGVLYPKKCLHSLVFNQDVFKKYCFLADDIWLNMMSRLAETNVSKTDDESLYLPVINRNDINLSTENVIKGMNDLQLRETREYIMDNYGMDPYKSIL
ncbi:glycosyl transferase [Wenyingzhuangia marina]|nr:glycosyl transferase [Wenyingzhuangia marina]